MTRRRLPSPPPPPPPPPPPAGLSVQPAPGEALQNRDWIAGLHRVTPGTIVRWARDGMKPVVGGGQGKQALFLPSATVAFRVAQLEVRIAGADPLLNPARERALRDRSQRRLADQLRRRRSGEVLELADVEQTWSAIVAAVRAKLLAVPSSLTPLVHAAAGDGLPAVERVLTAAIRDVLRELAVLPITDAPRDTPLTPRRHRERPSKPMNGGAR